MPKKTQKLDLSLVIACYNEERHLEHNVGEIIRTLDLTRLNYELILVDDASPDRTREAIARLLEAYPDQRWRTIFHERNQGRGRTVSDGFFIAAGEVAGYLDVDLEVSAHYIPALVQAVQDGADVAVGLRVYKFTWESLDRYILSRGYVMLMQKVLDLPLKDTESGCKFFRREKLLPLIRAIEDERWFWDTEFMARAWRAGLRIVEIPCLFIRRPDKASTVNPIADSLDYFYKLLRFRIKSGEKFF